MPELPEVETTRRGIEPHLLGARVTSLLLRERRLRWPVPEVLERALPGQRFESVGRRGKYLLLGTPAGHALLHLGMSGSLRVTDSSSPLRKHDHADFVLDNGVILRFHDPRRFGCILWLEGDPMAHPLLASLGPEPLSEDFNGAYLHARSRGGKAAVKSFLMDSKVVVGVGNIYANEALFGAGINPHRKAGAISRARYERLAGEVKQTLARAIEVGGTTLRDFVGGDGKPGYFSQSLRVYGRGGEPCPACGKPLRETRLGQRSTIYCIICQR